MSVNSKLAKDFPAQLANSLLVSRASRFVLVARARWFIFVLTLVYSCGAGFGYLLYDYELHISVAQMVGGAATLALLVVYNTLYSVQAEALAKRTFTDHLQILLDLTLVSLLIHYSGGAASWLWPLYLVITLEAAILIASNLQVWALGLFGGISYGMVLAGEHFDWYNHFEMPFVDTSLHHTGFYLLLKWLWVSVLCSATAGLGTYLMKTVRESYQQVFESESRLKGFLDEANDLIFSIDGQGHFLYTNRMWKNTLGYTEGDLQSLSMNDIIVPELRDKCMAEVGKAVGGEKVSILESQLINKSGEVVNVEGSITCRSDQRDGGNLWVICRDITARQKAQEQIYFLAHHDLLTGLPNRLSFTEALKQAEAMAQRQQEGFAVLYLDLDRFKNINDTLGHAAGDQLLQEVGRRLQQCVRGVDTVGRLGGDEFSIILTGIERSEAACQVAAKILKAMTSPIIVQEQELLVTTSIGISLYPEHARNGLQLVKKADAAMYQAKAHGRNNYQLYDPSLDEQEERRIQLENGLRQALNRNELYLLYQPKVNVATGEITALETLLRWRHPTLGTLYPNDFVPLAEESGTIIPIGLWMIRQACQDSARWQRLGLPKVCVAVSMSGPLLQSKGVDKKIAEILEETGLPREGLELEVAEAVIMQYPQQAAKVLGSLQKTGIQISIDHFGTGYSSLAHLKSFAVNALKIDSAFVRDIEISATDAAITSAIITMGNNLNLKVVAEGVESDSQLKILKEKQCDEMQGNLFSKPLSEHGVVELLRNGLDLVLQPLKSQGS
ncbi:MAG: GGDEF domain-containing protein [Desulfuromonas sp.]|nr:MAG: GGDEF domain-containing protein [Desulfuromonas sp.]